MVDKAVLAQFDFFSGLDDANLSALAARCQVLEFKPKDAVFRTGEPAKSLYGVIDGEVELTLPFKEKILKGDIRYEKAITAKYEFLEKPIVVEKIAAGEIFGWTSLVKLGMYTTSAICLLPARVFALPAAELRKMCQGNPALGYRVMSQLSEMITDRLQNRTDKLIEAWGEAFAVSEV